MRTIFSLFKDINIKIIWSLIRLLRMIILNSHINLMPLQNVCKMIAPNIFRPPSSNQLSTSQQQVNAQISAISCSPIILETLILRSYELFDDVCAISYLFFICKILILNSTLILSLTWILLILISLS